MCSGHLIFSREATSNKYCTSFVRGHEHHASGSSSPFWLFVEHGPAHITILNPYVAFEEGTDQIAWLRHDFASADMCHFIRCDGALIVFRELTTRKQTYHFYLPADAVVDVGGYSPDQDPLAHRFATCALVQQQHYPRRRRRRTSCGTRTRVHARQG